MWRLRLWMISVVLLSSVVMISAQETKAEQKNARPIMPSARIAAAKTAQITSVGGSEIPYNVINSAMESWGRFSLVDTPEKADIIIEVSSPEEGGGGSGVSVSSSTKHSRLTGRPEDSTTTSRQISNAPIRMIVYDAKSRMALWSASEQPKYAMKQKAKEDNLVQAAQRLFSKWRERVEPTPAQ